MNRLRWLGLGLTGSAVAILLGSMLAGLGGGGEAVGAEDPRESRAADRRSVRVEVLNAAGITGLARAATVRLRDAGFDVVYYGNASGFSPDTSLVLLRAGPETRAHEVAATIGIEQVRADPDSSLFVDVTVIVGRDWSGYAPPVDAPPGALPDD